jgi:hypothetical protein
MPPSRSEGVFHVVRGARQAPLAHFNGGGGAEIELRKHKLGAASYVIANWTLRAYEN